MHSLKKYIEVEQSKQIVIEGAVLGDGKCRSKCKNLRLWKRIDLDLMYLMRVMYSMRANTDHIIYSIIYTSDLGK